LEYRRIAAHLGARVALLKPVTRADLMSAVTDVLAGRLSSNSHNVDVAKRA
jgi:DNA-binding NarL/FixJ family response regulator